MNFDWLEEYVGGKWSSWDDDSFRRYGVTENELVYAWAISGTSETTLKYIEDLVLSGMQDNWQEDDDVFEVKGDLMIVSTIWRESYYTLPYEEFVEHVNMVIKARKNAL